MKTQFKVNSVQLKYVLPKIKAFFAFHKITNTISILLSYSQKLPPPHPYKKNRLDIIRDTPFTSLLICIGKII